MNLSGLNYTEWTESAKSLPLHHLSCFYSLNGSQAQPKGEMTLWIILSYNKPLQIKANSQTNLGNWKNKYYYNGHMCPRHKPQAFQKAGHPSILTPGAVGHEANGQWSSLARPHHSGPNIFFYWRVKKTRTPEKATPASKAADRT